MLRRDAEQRGEAFNARPYFRLSVGLISELAPAPGADDAAGFGMLVALASAFHALQPLRVPGFAFSWLELISHRCGRKHSLCCDAFPNRNPPDNRCHYVQ